MTSKVHFYNELPRGVRIDQDWSRSKQPLEFEESTVSVSGPSRRGVSACKLSERGCYTAKVSDEAAVETCKAQETLKLLEVGVQRGI